MNTHLPYFFFIFLAVPSWALPSFRSVIGNHGNHDMSTSVIVGIVIGSLLLLLIPLLWYAYKMCHRNMPESTSVPVYTNACSPPRRATRPHKVNVPASGA